MSIYNSGTKTLSIFYQGNFIAKGYAQNNMIFNGDLVTLTISPSEQDASVQFTTTDAKIISDNSITVRKGTTVNYTVSKSGYRTVTDSIIVQTTSTINVQLFLDRVLDVEDYNYTTETINNNINVTLTEYIGSNTSVIVPQITTR